MSAILINGDWQEAELARDRGLYYGDGLFETLSCTGEHVPLLGFHLQRLFEGCERLHIPKPDETVLRQELETVRLSGPGPAVIKLIYTRGDGERGYRLPDPVQPRRLWYRMPWPDLPVEYRQEGVAVRICAMRLSEQPALAGLKTLNRLEQVMGRAEWNDADIQEGIMLSTRGDVIEGTMSNVFAVKNGELFTPPLDRCGVAGVMRRKVMEVAAERGIGCRITALELESLQQADEVFLTNSLIGIWPVRNLARMSYSPGPVTRNLQSAIAAFVPCYEVSAV